MHLQSHSEIAKLPPEAREELAATKTYDPIFGTTTSATHIAALEIDPQTYEIRIDRFVVGEPLAFQFDLRNGGEKELRGGSKDARSCTIILDNVSYSFNAPIGIRLDELDLFRHKRSVAAHLP